MALAKIFCKALQCCVASACFQMLGLYVFRHLEIGRDSHKLIDAKVQASGLDVVKEPYEFGKALGSMQPSLMTSI